MKKTVFFRSAAFLLAILMLSCLLIACGDNTENEVTTPTVSTKPVDPNEVRFPEADYGGETFLVYARNQDAAHYRGFYIVPFEDSADVIDEQARIRNIRVEEKYHVKLQTREVEQPYLTLETDVATGAVDYQAMLAYRNGMGPLQLKGLFYNLHNLNCDLTAPWWDKNAAEQYDVGGKLYLMPNDISVSNLACVRFFFFSKGILEDYHVKSPYDFVEEDNWTLDSFLELVRSVSNVPDDGSYGVYGLLDDSGVTVRYLMTGIGAPKLSADNDGMIICDFGTTYGERAQNFLDKFKTVADNPNYTLSITQACNKDKKADDSADVYIHARKLFMDDHFLFIHTDMEVAAREFGDMKRGFGVVMNPKFDNNQEEYYHPIDTEALIWGIPNDINLDPEKVSNVMDYWAYKSTDTVMESFYELTIKGKRASDPLACKMLDTVKSSIRYYASDIYSLPDVNSMLSEAYGSSVATAWGKFNRAITHALEKLYENVDNIEE